MFGDTYRHRREEGRWVTEAAPEPNTRSRLLKLGSIAQARTRFSPLVRVSFREHMGWLSNALWLAFVLFSLGLFIATIPARYMNLRDEVRLVGTALDQLPMDADFLPGYIMAFDALNLVVYVLVGIAIFWRKRLGWIGFFNSLILVLVGTVLTRPTDALFFVRPELRVPMLLLFAFGTVAVYLFLFTFPDGHFVPGWTVWLVLISVANVVATFLGPALTQSPLRWPPAPPSPAIFIPIGIGAGLQIYRYHHRSTKEQRQQIKWVIYGLTIAVAGLLSFSWLVPIVRPQVLEPGLDHSLYIFVGTPLVYLCLMLFPLTMAVAIHFRRLWDIDLLINRTLVYLSLTAILAGVYTASITLFQKVFIALTGQQSDLAIVLATLMIAAAFTPIKNYLQVLIDQHWKETEDAAKRLRALGEQIETRISPVEPLRITDRLLKVAVTGFNAKGGAVFWSQDGALKMIHSQGQWDGDAQATADLTGDQNRRLGFLALGARRNGVEYTERDRQVLGRIAGVVARAIEQDGQRL